MYRALVTLLLCFVLGSPSMATAAEHWVFAHSGDKPGPLSATNPATEVLVGGLGSPGHNPDLLYPTNYYEIQFGPSTEECYDFHGTVMADFAPKRCSAGSGNPKAPCTTSGDCTNGGTCDDQTIGGFFLYEDPALYCLAGSNAFRECNNDADCPSSTCHDTAGAGQIHMKVSFVCVGAGEPYKSIDMTQTSGMGMELAGGQGPQVTMVPLPALPVTSCAVGEEWVLQFCRQPAAPGDDFASWVAMLALRLSM